MGESTYVDHGDLHFSIKNLLLSFLAACRTSQDLQERLLISRNVIGSLIKPIN